MMLAGSVAAAVAVLCLLAPRVGDAQTEATPARHTRRM